MQSIVYNEDKNMIRKLDNHNVSLHRQIGHAAEYYVCGDLTLKGFVVSIPMQGIPYDLILDVDSVLFKVQVKSTRIPIKIPQRVQERHYYRFQTCRSPGSKKTQYLNSEIDIYAFVCYDTMKIGYETKEFVSPSSMSFRADNLRGTYFDEEYTEKYSLANKLFAENVDLSIIAEKCGVKLAHVKRYISGEYKPKVCSTPYFSSIERDASWFKSLAEKRIRCQNQ